MSAHVKLFRLALAMTALIATVGCGAPAKSSACPVPPAPTVGTTRVMAAELAQPENETEANDAPKVGKPHRSFVSDDKQDASKHPDRRPGGGFSGYK